MSIAVSTSALVDVAGKDFATYGLDELVRRGLGTQDARDCRNGIDRVDFDGDDSTVVLDHLQHRARPFTQPSWDRDLTFLGNRGFRTLIVRIPTR